MIEKLRVMSSVRSWRLPAVAISLLAASLFAPGVEARITRLELSAGAAFGNAPFEPYGVFEKLVGVAYGELDPDDESNRLIQDLEFAPRNERGMVEYKTDVYIVRPRESAGNRTLLVDLPNRGNKWSVMSFNVGADAGVALSDPAVSLAGAGDGFLLRQGFTLLWVGWQGDLLAAPNRMRLEAPTALRRDGSAISGRVRTEYIVNAPVSTQNLSSGAFTGLTHASYPPVSLDNAGATLTRRLRQDAPREKVANSDWAFADCSATAFPGQASDSRICLKNGFDPNYIYELLYTARDPKVLGIGFAATRDVVSYLRNAQADEAGNANPLADTIDTALAYGLSQAGRYIRTFLHLGFNADERGRRVFDGLNLHIAPALIPLNVRFGQPGRAYGQREEHDFPAAEGPFSWGRHEREAGGFTDGLLERCSKTATCPKVVQTISSIEYWQGRMSLGTTDRHGRHDLYLPQNVRLYHFSGTQHVPGGGHNAACKQPNNFHSYQEGQRALLLALQRWVAAEVPPPANRYPEIAKGTLVPPGADRVGWPSLPGGDPLPEVNAYQKLGFGPRFDAEDESGILREPPRVGRREFELLVPRVDADGNELGGVRSAAIRAPIGTFVGWNVRRPGFGEGDLCGLAGSYYPFAQTSADRAASGDPRPSLAERYMNHDGYVAAVRKATAEVVAEGFLLQEDADRLVKEADASSILR